MKKFIYSLSLISFFCLEINTNLRAQWENIVVLNTAPYNIQLCENNARSMGTSGDTIHIVFARGSSQAVFYIRSTNKGDSWDSARQLSVNAVFLEKPSIAVFGSILHVVWYANLETRIFYRRSTNGGNTWDTAQVIDNDVNDSKYTSVTVDGSNVYVVWSDNRSGIYQIYLKYSTNNGNTWSSAVQVSHETSDCLFASICTLNSTVHVVWSLIYDNRKVRYSRTTNNGLNWSAVINLNDDPFVTWKPCITTSGSVLRAVWIHEYQGGIYTDYSTDNGLNWNIDRRLSDTTSAQKIVSLFSDGTVLHLVWRQGIFYEPFYKCSYDGGNSWGGEFQLFSTNATTSYELGSPCAAVSGNVLHVVWVSLVTIDDFCLFYRRNLTGNMIGIKPISTLHPKEFSLYQNFPNPFNPTTKIRFSLPAPSKGGLQMVSLLIYDVLGRQIASLIPAVWDGQEGLKPGTYEVDWNGSAFGSGIYFYTLISGNFKETKKMIIVK